MDRRQFLGTAALGGLQAFQGSIRFRQVPDWKSWRVDGERLNRHLAELSH